MGVESVRDSAVVEQKQELRRVIGEYEVGLRGPTVLLLGGIHGNEPAGVQAAARVLARLRREELPLRGKLIGLAGNLGALRRGRRFIHRDLNRLWSERTARERREGLFDPGVSEHHEMLELLAEIDRAELECRGDLFVFDLHSSSAVGAPFNFISDTLRNRRVALGIPAPLILGIEELIHGSILEYLQSRGHGCIAVEGGQHLAPATADNHESAVWLGLVRVGVLDRTDLPDLDEHHRRLKEAGRNSPGVVEIDYRHRIEAGDGFEMVPGFDNFSAVKAEELLARDRSGEIRCRRDGLLLLPLYQGQGDDGFFVARNVARSWLRLSALMRRLRLACLARILPGVRRDPINHAVLDVDARVARLFPVEVMHLLGFRRLPAVGGGMRFERRLEYPPR